MNISELRKTTGLSQKGFADIFHIPVRTLQEWEQQRRKCPDYIPYMMEMIIEYKNLSISAPKEPLRYTLPDDVHKEVRKARIKAINGMDIKNEVEKAAEALTNEMTDEYFSEIETEYTDALSYINSEIPIQSEIPSAYISQLLSMLIKQADDLMDAFNKKDRKKTEFKKSVIQAAGTEIQNALSCIDRQWGNKYVYSFTTYRNDEISKYIESLKNLCEKAEELSDDDRVDIASKISAECLGSMQFYT